MTETTTYVRDSKRYSRIGGLLLMALMVMGGLRATAQTVVDDGARVDEEEVVNSLTVLTREDSVTLMVPLDTVAEKKRRDWTAWRPDSKRALWLALVIPGGGQIYNRKYWKLPIIYGGFVGCIYAMTWNNQMFHDYSQAYMDIMDDDPATQSYNTFLHLGNQVSESNQNYYQELFRKRKDRYRRYRDLSIFAMIGVYALSVIDAYVDASLSEFDISDDLSLHVAPTVFGDQTARNPMKPAAIGVGCSLTF